MDEGEIDNTLNEDIHTNPVHPHNLHVCSTQLIHSLAEIHRENDWYRNQTVVLPSLVAMGPEYTQPAGMGLFATRTILRGERISIFAGNPILTSQHEKLDASEVDITYDLSVTDKWTIQVPKDMRRKLPVPKNYGRSGCRDHTRHKKTLKASTKPSKAKQRKTELCSDAIRANEPPLTIHHTTNDAILFRTTAPPDDAGAEYDDHIASLKHANRFYKTHQLEIFPNATVYLDDEEELDRYMQKNFKKKKKVHVHLVSLKTIVAGEEIFYCYGKSDMDWKSTCDKAIAFYNLGMPSE